MENRLSHVIDLLPGLIWTARSDGAADFVNRRWCEYTGLGFDQALAHGWLAAVHPDDRPGVLERWRLITASGEPGELEGRLRRFDGEHRWFLFRASPLTDASGKVVGWCGVNTDIEGHKAAEDALHQRDDAALKRSEARKAAILDSALDGIVTIDHQGRITEFNPAAERIFGYHRDEVLGERMADVIIPPRLREQHLQGLARYLATGVAKMIGRHIELTAMRADGTEFPVELAITRILSDGPASFTGYLRDITDRRRAHEALRRSEAFLAEGQRLSLTGTFSWRVDTDEIAFSGELCRIFGFEGDGAVTFERIAGRVHPDDLPLLTETIAAARGGGGDLDYEIRLRMPDGSVRRLHTIARGSRDQDGRVEYFGAVQDITERRISEEALGKVRSEFARIARVTSLGALTASIAHEVNQPLSGIITNASTCLKMLAADPPNVVGALETARRTIRDGNRAADVIARLRALFSREGSASEAVDLNEAVREVVALAWGDLQRNQVLLRSELADELAPVTGDRVQLQQVVLNLLLNASDAMSGIDDRPRLLVITTESAEDDQVRMSVRDVGVGFDGDGMSRLFEPFYTTKSGGMGIGLSVSRSIIESHHGHLWAAQNDGPGATFSFSIPRSPPDETDGGPRAIAPASADRRPRLGTW